MISLAAVAANGYYVHDFSPFLVEFYPGIGLRYYSLAYIIGFVGLYLWLSRQARRGLLPLPEASLPDLFVYLMAGTIIGGRVGYALCYGWDRWLHDPLWILKLYEGGMSAHGGIAGVMLGMWLYARQNKVPFFPLSDAVVLAVPLFLAIGRVANFINGELWGRPSLVPWAVIFREAPLVDGVMAPRHPSQLYQAGMEGLLLFALLLWLSRWKLRPGMLSVAFLAGYAVLRSVGELFREPDAQLGFILGGWMTQGQLLSLAVLLAAGWAYCRAIAVDQAAKTPSTP